MVNLGGLYELELERIGKEMSSTKKGVASVVARYLIPFSGCVINFENGVVVGRNVIVPMRRLVMRFSNRFEKYEPLKSN